MDGKGKERKRIPTNKVAAADGDDNVAGFRDTLTPCLGLRVPISPAGTPAPSSPHRPHLVRRQIARTAFHNDWLSNREFIGVRRRISAAP